MKTAESSIRVSLPKFKEKKEILKHSIEKMRCMDNFALHQKVMIYNTLRMMKTIKLEKPVKKANVSICEN